MLVVFIYVLFHFGILLIRESKQKKHGEGRNHTRIRRKPLFVGSKCISDTQSTRYWNDCDCTHMALSICPLIETRLTRSYKWLIQFYQTTFSRWMRGPGRSWHEHFFSVTCNIRPGKTSKNYYQKIAGHGKKKGYFFLVFIEPLLLNSAFTQDDISNFPAQ